MEWGQYILPVATRAWGEPTRRTKNEVFFGAKFSKKILLDAGTWYDHEADIGGGVVDLIRRIVPDAGVNGAVADFLRDELGVELEEYVDPTDVSAFKASAPYCLVAEYTYLRADGTPHLVVKRLENDEGKRFVQQLPNGARPSSDPDFKPIPYRLERIAAAQSSAPVFVVEGEKCVHAAESLGLLATCNPMGAGKWTDDMSPYLAGRRVVVVPDNDVAGDAHARKVIASLQGIAAEIRRVDLPGLPHKGDIADWVEAGGDKAQLIELCKAAAPTVEIVTPLRALSLADLMRRQPSGFLIDKLVPAASLTAIYGEPGSYKTFLVLDMMLSLAHGAPFHGVELERQLVVYVAGEGVGGLRKRVGAWHAARNRDPADASFILIEEPVPLREEGGIEALMQTIDMLRGELQPVCIVYDTLARCMSGDENSAQDMGDAIKAVDAVRAHYSGSTALLVHHQGKAAERGMRGSSALLGALDCALQAKKQDALLEVVTQKQKDHEPAEPMWFRTEQVEFQVTAFDDPDSSLVLELLEEKPTIKLELTPAERKCLEALYEAIIAHGYVASDIPWPTCTLDQWRETAAGMTITDGGPDAHRKAFKRAATKLEVKGIVAARNGRIWPVRYAENGKNEADYEN